MVGEEPAHHPHQTQDAKDFKAYVPVDVRHKLEGRDKQVINNNIEQLIKVTFACQGPNIVRCQGQIPQTAWLYPEILSLPCYGTSLAAATISYSTADGGLGALW